MIEPEGNRRVLLRCECHSLDHIAELSVWDDGEALFTFHIKTWRSFWRRISYAFCYLFGIEPSCGAWDELCLSKDDAVAMREVLEVHLANVRRREVEEVAVREKHVQVAGRSL